MTVLNYFDELEIHPVHIRKCNCHVWYCHCGHQCALSSASTEIDHDHSPDMQQTVNRIMEMIGEARNYGALNSYREIQHGGK